jgi:hypothetical protein
MQRVWSRGRPRCPRRSRVRQRTARNVVSQPGSIARGRDRLRTNKTTENTTHLRLPVAVRAANGRLATRKVRVPSMIPPHQRHPAGAAAREHAAAVTAEAGASGCADVQQRKWVGCVIVCRDETPPKTAPRPFGQFMRHFACVVTNVSPRSKRAVDVPISALIFAARSLVGRFRAFHNDCTMLLKSKKYRIRRLTALRLNQRYSSKFCQTATETPPVNQQTFLRFAPTFPAQRHQTKLENSQRKFIRKCRVGKTLRFGCVCVG